MPGKMPIRVASFITLVLVLATWGCGRSHQDTAPAGESPFGLSIQASAVPVQGESGQAQLTASSRGVILSWLERKDVAATLKFSEITSTTWSEARTVASSDRWFVSDADPPAVMRMSDGMLVAALSPLIDIRLEAYDLRLTYSPDDGRTWSPLFAPYQDKTKTQHGFASLFELPGRQLGVVWLDGRDQELKPGDQLRESMDVRFASFDRNWKQTSESLINQRVCQCCQTAAAVADDGPVVAFRDRSDKEIRDIHVTRLEQPSTVPEGGKWTDASPVHEDNWQIDGCPVNGPALSARGRTVAVAWFTAVGDSGRAYASFSQDAGRTWGEPIRLDDGSSLGQVDIELLDDGSAVATWIEFANERPSTSARGALSEVEGRNQVRVRQVKPSRERSTSVVLAGNGEPRVSGYPHVARHGSDLVFVWSESAGGPQQVKAAIGKVK
jgi:hypothetical protein